jgi:hypothetical protein
MFFQAQMNAGCEPRKLIFGETDYSFFAEHPVTACSLKSIFEEGIFYAENRFPNLLWN